MPNFLDLPRELRDLIYQFCLIGKEPVDPWRDWYYQVPSYGLAISLLRVSKAVYREASPVLYSQNIFEFDKRPPDMVDRFLDRIGSINAYQIRHIKVDFPDVYGSLCGHLRLGQGLDCVLWDTRHRCPHVHTVTVSNWYVSGLVILCWPPPDRYLEFATAVLTWVDSLFRSLPSLRQIVVEPRGYLDPNHHVRQEMARLGWTASWPVKSDKVRSD